MGTNQSKLNDNQVNQNVSIKPSPPPVPANNILQTQNQPIKKLQIKKGQIIDKQVHVQKLQIKKAQIFDDQVSVQKLQIKKEKLITDQAKISILSQHPDLIQSENVEVSLSDSNIIESFKQNNFRGQINAAKASPKLNSRQRMSIQLNQFTEIYLLASLKSINKRVFQLDEYVWIHQDVNIYFNNFPKLFKKNNFYPIQCSKIQYLREMLQERPHKKFVIFTSSKFAQSICNQFSELQKIRSLYILSASQGEGRPENLKQFYNKVIFTSTDFSLLISKAQYSARCYEKNSYTAKLSKINQLESDQITRTKLKGLLQYHDKSQAKQQFMQLIYYLFPESRHLKQVQGFFRQYSDQQSQDLILNWYTRDTFFFNFLNKFLSYTMDIYMLSYIRFPLERTFNAIKSIYEKTKHKNIFKSYRRCNLSQEQISSFVNNVGGFVQLFGFMSTSLNQQKNASGNCLMVIQVNKQERDKKIDYGYVNFNEFNLNDFNEDQILFNILNVFKVVSVNKEDQYVAITLRYNEFSKLFKHYELSKLIKNSPEYLTQVQYKIIDKYSLNYQAIRMFKSQFDIIKAIGESIQQYQKLHHLKYITHTQLHIIQSKTKQMLNNNIKISQYYKQIVNQLQILKGFEILLISDIYKIIALYYRNEQNYPKTFEYYQHQLQIKMKHFGQEHLIIADLSYNIASLYDQVLIVQKAMHYYKKALNIYLKQYGSFHVKTIKTLHHVTCLYQAKGFYQKALRLYNKLYDLQLNSIGQQQLDTAKTLTNIGTVYCNQGIFNQALVSYNKALLIYKKLEQNEQLAITYGNIGKLYKQKNNLSQSLIYYKKAYELRQRINGKSHELTLKIQKKIRQLKQQIKS